MLLVGSIKECSCRDTLASGATPLLRFFTKGSVANRSEKAQQGGGGWVALCGELNSLSFFSAVSRRFYSSVLIFLPWQESETATPAQEVEVARASSLNPRTVFMHQSVAQLEPHAPSAQNSNRCQSVGFDQQLVFVRMSRTQSQ